MEFLKFLESIRNPFLDGLFSLITHLGEETIFIIIGIFIFWCISKKKGYYILFVGFMGVVLNQALKITFRIPRPWVKDPSFTIVESARAEATGYSFPSGHTQVSVGAYGSMARCFKNTVLRIICIILCVLVPLSRMYLGVHTPLDVGVSVALALLLTFGLYPVVNKALESKNRMRVLFLGIIAISVLYLLYVELGSFPNDPEGNYISALENAYKILGAMLGVWAGYEIDAKFINFETKAIWWAQILKVIIGLIPVLIIKSVLKAPLSMITGDALGNLIRYFLITGFACGIWPFTFKFFKNLK